MAISNSILKLINQNSLKHELPLLHLGSQIVLHFLRNRLPRNNLNMIFPCLLTFDVRGSRDAFARRVCTFADQKLALELWGLARVYASPSHELLHDVGLRSGIFLPQFRVQILVILLLFRHVRVVSAQNVRVGVLDVSVKSFRNFPQFLSLVFVLGGFGLKIILFQDPRHNVDLLLHAED